MQKIPIPTALSRLPTLQQIKDYDQKRADFPGEHLVAFGAGLALLMASLRSRSLGSALLYRAVSGQKGLTKMLRFLPAGWASRR